MKKLIKTIAFALVATVVTFNANADDKKTEATLNVGMYRVNNSLKMNVLVENKSGKASEIKLKNNKGEVLHWETVSKKTKSYSKKWNMEGLEDGKYTFEITNGKEKIVKEFELSTKNPTPADLRTIALK